jgi:hypothetical protein
MLSLSNESEEEDYKESDIDCDDAGAFNFRIGTDTGNADKIVK